MADRKASVALELQASQFKAETAAAGRAVDGLDRKVEDLDRDVDKLGRDSLKAGAEVGTLGAEAKKTGTSVEDLGKKTEGTTDKAGRARDEFGRFKRTTDEVGAGVEDLGKKTEELGQKTSASADQFGKFDKRIAELKASVKSLAAEFERTGDPKLLKKFRADSSELAGLTKMRKELGGLTQDAEKFAAESEKAGMSLGDLATPAMVGGIAALVVPALALAGALTSVAAAGGIAGAGIAGAVAGNPAAFKDEWSAAIFEIKRDWIDASAPFVGPTLAAIRSVGPLVASWHLDTMFAKAATFVGPLVQGVEGFATGVEKGVAALVDKAGPEIKVLAAELPQIGNAIGTALKLISDNSEGGAQALHDFDVALEKTIIAVGGLISGAEGVAGALTSANASVKHFLDDIPSFVYVLDPLLLIPRKLADAFTPEPFNASAAAAGRLGSSLAGVTGAVGDFGTVGGDAMYTIDRKISDTIAMVDRMNKAFDEATKTILNQRDADVAVAQGLADLTKGWKSGSDALDINTQKGRDNVTLIDRTISELERKREADIAAGGGTKDAYDKANAAYQQAIRGLQNTIEHLGVGKAAAQQFMDAFKDKTINITVKVHQVGTVNVQGVISGGAPRGTVGIPTAYEHGGIRRAAAGMIVPPRDPGTVLFGEPQTGGEALIPLRGISQSAAMGLVQTVGNAYGFQVSRGSSSGGWGGPVQLVYGGTVGGLDGLHLSWLAEQSRKGNLQIHAKSVIS
jgi:hypothetical protein